MSIFKKALDYLIGKKEQQEKEFQEKLEKGLEELLKKQAPQEFIIKTQEPECKENKIIFNANNGSLQVITCMGDTFQGFGVTWEIVQKCKQADTAEIIRLLSPEIEEQIKCEVEQVEKEIVKPFLSVFDNVDDFTVVGDNVYFTGVKSVAIPSLIVARFLEIINSYEFIDLDGVPLKEYLLENGEYQSLKAFTLKLLLNPLASSREQLLTFVRKNNVTITSKGNLVLYRACYEGNNANKLVKFVAKEYLKIKAWKKAPSQYEVYDDNGYVAVHTDKLNGYNKHIGNLAELYSQLPEMQKNGKQYYSSHGKKKMVIGDIYKIDDSEVDLDASVCASGGLHAASVDYDYSGFGDTNLVVLINPAKTITVPTYDFGKMRVSEMMIVGINPNERGVHISEDFYADLDDNYHNYSLEELEHALQTKSVESVSVSIAMSDVSLKDVEVISNLLKNRIVQI